MDWESAITKHGMKQKTTINFNMMKTILLSFIFSTSIAFSVWSQACITPVSNTFFQQRYQQITSSFDENTRLTMANNLVAANCLSSWQIKQLALALNGDASKFEFCKNAYANTTDKDNFYDVYDAFAYFSSVFKLHDHILKIRTIPQNNTVVPAANINTNNAVLQNNIVSYPPVPYPETTGYLGITQCNFPVNDAEINGYALHVLSSQMSLQARTDFIKNIIQTKCLTTSQIMKLTTTITMESVRLDILKSGITKVYDKGNYEFARYVLSSDVLINDFINTLSGRINPQQNNINQQPQTNNCVVSNADMNQIKSSIGKENFASTKMNIAKQAISGKKCFTVTQLKEIILLFSFEDNKLDLAKYSYVYCSDKQNYYQINDVFNFSSSKDELNKFIQSMK